MNEKRTIESSRKILIKRKVEVAVCLLGGGSEYGCSSEIDSCGAQG